MRAINEIDYKEDFPENFNWNLLDSIRMSELAKEISFRIHGESLLIPSQRHGTCGFRRVLNMMAEQDL